MNKHLKNIQNLIVQKYFKYQCNTNQNKKIKK